MSEENLEAVRRLVEAWNERDVERLFALGHPDVEYVNPPTAIEPGTRRGRAEVEAAMRTQWDMMLDARQEVERVWDRGDEVVFEVRLTHRMPGSESRIEDRALIGVTFRDGKVARYEVLAQGASAVADAVVAMRLRG